MRTFIYKAHTWLGVIVAVPLFAWASSGLLYAWPNAVEGGKVEKIDAAKVLVTPADAMARANKFAGKQLPVSIRKETMEYIEMLLTAELVRLKKQSAT